ncbi:methyltransferase domain-containing protein [Phragmitibacter flavus]|uniref:Methyltransferase domain-containing protein n=1 Tax=Phragmitibacter flavus TaxID=2576071 RepID=A0A5R8KE71_9BACT|nr:class I SAM-dependent methyltransferase [Phragmitibacter flavus]TLD70606.1 methyltransferase domain-containing protein [Phragmitibacter flavus]
MTSPAIAIAPPKKISPSQSEMARCISRRFPNQLSFRAHRHYAKWKILTDPLYGAVFDALKDSPHPVLDIGCGMGLLAFYLRERGMTVPVHGVDFDAAKIQTAQLLAKQYSPEPQFETGDMRKPWPEVHGNVCLLDILQYLEVKGRAELLAKAASHVVPGGLLVIRGSMKEPTWRWRVNYSMDHIANALSWMKAAPVSYPTHDELVSVLKTCGLQLKEARPLWGRTPFNMHFQVFERH